MKVPKNGKRMTVQLFESNEWQEIDAARLITKNKNKKRKKEIMNGIRCL